MKTEQMEEVKHTPGPWRLKSHGVNTPEGGNGIVHSFGGAHRFVVIAGVGQLETVDMDVAKLEANARLIAAAPELLEALKELTVHVLELGFNGCAQEIAQARAALSKATKGNQ